MRIHPRAVTALRIATALTIAYFLLRKIDPGQLAGVLRHTYWQGIGLAALLNLLLNTPARTLRFAALIAPLPRTGRRIHFFELMRLLLATRTLNFAFPARTGEAFRLARLRGAHGYRADAVIAALLMETLIEAVALAGAALAILCFARLTPGWTLYWILAITAAACATLFLLNRRSRSQHPFLKALRLLSTRRLWQIGLAWTWAADAVDLITIGLCLSAVGIEQGVGTWLLVLLSVNLAIALPVTPGNVGTLEAGAVGALAALGTPHNSALAFALLYHAAQVVPIAAAGLLELAVAGAATGERRTVPSRTQAQPSRPRAKNA